MVPHSWPGQEYTVCLRAYTSLICLFDNGNEVCESPGLPPAVVSELEGLSKEMERSNASRVAAGARSVDSDPSPPPPHPSLTPPSLSPFHYLLFLLSLSIPPPPSLPPSLPLSLSPSLQKCSGEYPGHLLFGLSSPPCTHHSGKPPLLTRLPG